MGDNRSWVLYFNNNESLINGSRFSEADFNITGAEDIFQEFLNAFHGLSNASTTVLICLYVPTFFVALSGNALLLLTIFCRQTSRTVRNYFFVNLALADLTITFVCMPTAVSAHVYKVWIYGEWLCKASSFLQAVAASIFTLVAMSVDRFLAIACMWKKHRITSRRKALAVLILIWIVSALLSSPLLFVKHFESRDLGIPQFGKILICIETWNSQIVKEAYGIVSLVAIYIIPVLTLAVCYSRISEALCNSPIDVMQMDVQSRNHRGSIMTILSTRRTTARVLIALVVIFTMFWLPYNVTSLVLDYTSNNAYVGFLHFALWLGHTHSAINPILFWCCSRGLRKGLRKLQQACCRRCLCGSPDHHPVAVPVSPV